MKYLKIFIKERKAKFALAVLLIILQSVGTLLIPYLIALIVDDGIIAGDMGVIIRIGAWMLLVSVLSAALAVWSSWCSSDLAAMFGRDMRGRLV